MSFTPQVNSKDAVFTQRSDNNTKYEQINISGSDVIVYLDENGHIMADKISVWANKYGIGSADTSSWALTASLALTSSYLSGSLVVPGNDREILINDGGNIGIASGFALTTQSAFIFNAVSSEPTASVGSTYYNSIENRLYISIDDSELWTGCGSTTTTTTSTTTAAPPLAPNEISNDMLIWLDASYGTYTTAGLANQGEKVTEWDSQPYVTESLSLWATASSGLSSAPTLGTFSGQNGILFDQAAGYQYTIYHDVVEAMYAATSGSMVWVAATREGRSLHNLSGYAGDENLYPSGTGTNIWEGFGTSLIKTISTPSGMLSGSGWYVYSVRAENGRFNMRVNGVDIFDTGSANVFDIYAHSAITFYLGYDNPNGGWWYDGYLGEFVMYNGYVSNSEITSLENYYISKYGIV